MKKVVMILLILTIFMLCSCSFPKDEAVASLGKYESKIYYTSGGFQDFTDYAIYTFDKVDFSDNEYFTLISPESWERLERHIEDFEKWIEIIKRSDSENEVVLGYDFDSSVISDRDYLYIFDDPDYPELGCYNVYFFDIETMTLYYFHNNI